MLTLEAALAAGATLVALAFACAVLDRWAARRRRHDLAWSISLGMFALASGALWWGASAGWSEWTFRTFFLFGAILNVPWLALGSVYLLAGRRAGDRVAAGVALWSAFAAGVLVVAPLQAAIPTDDLPRGKDVFGPLPRVLAAVSSGVAATVIIVLALVSAARLLQGRARSRAAPAAVARPGRLALGNVLIATGTVVLSASGTLNARLGEMTAFAVTLAAGVTVLFVGFLVAAAAAVPAAPVPPPAGLPAGSAEHAPEELAAHALR